MHELVERARGLYDDGKSLIDIADALGVARGTVRAWKSRYKWPESATKRNDVATQQHHGVTKRNGVATRRSAVAVKVAQIVDEFAEPLNDNQRVFAEYYADNRNATQAYIKAYNAEWSTANRNSARLMANPKVRAYVDELLKLKRESIMLKPDDVLEKYMRIAFANITDFAEFNAHGVMLKHSGYVDGGVIKEVKQTAEGTSIKLLDQLKALEWLAKYFDMFPADKHRREYDLKRLELQERELKLHESKAPPAPDDTEDDGLYNSISEAVAK